ncbi:DUF3786 domain-containing protein [Desulfopila sp. IMCC35008]|uniref:DUF3786 domain-containing protein n=1 Tax=Desulfopila sp. IMCC35008 TaxID=2653858 RepID=UPI0013D686EA|nr:DUF3786 domain-containing protein [Desulfopila sp. IMCC35008]
MSSTVSPSHFKDLLDAEPGDVCTRSLCSYDNESGKYSLHAWGRQYCIDPANETIVTVDNKKSLHGYFDLFLIHHLLGAQALEPTGEWISEKDMPGGATFFRGPHAVPTELITGVVGDDLDLFRKMCESFGGTPLGMGDAAYSFTITDRVPVAILYWVGDEDFPAEAKILYDRTITEHLELDGVYALMVSICNYFTS